MAISDHPDNIRACLKILAQTPRLQNLSRQDQLRLLMASGVAEIQIDPQGSTPSATAFDASPSALPPEIDVSDGIAVVLRGTFSHDNVLLGPGQVVGLDAVVNAVEPPAPDGTESAPMPAPVTAKIAPVTEGTYLWIPRVAIDELATTSCAFRQAMGFTQRQAEIVEFNAAALPTVPTSLIIWMLGHEIVTAFPNDRVLIAVPVGQAAGVRQSVPGVPDLFYMEGLPNDPVALALLRQDFDYIFLDGINPANITPHRRVVFLDSVPSQDPPIGASGPVVLRAIVVDQSVGARRESGDPTWVEKDGLTTGTASSVRVLFDLDGLNSQASTWSPPSLPVVTGPTQGYSMGAFARALTQRRTGVALAGGGVWSMQAVFILRELARRRVPVDVVIGPSGGAMLGGYYAVDGIPGLDDIVKQGKFGLLNLMSFAAMISPTLMKWYFDANLGCDTRIEHLLREFYPSGTDLSQGSGVVFRQGSLAKFIAAASSAVPLVASTIVKGRRFVDGAYSNNVPAQALKYFGVTLSFGANTFPPASRESLPFIPSFIQQLCSLSLFNRLLDFVTAFNLLGSVSGANESAQASVSWDSEVGLNPTFVLTINFFLSQIMVDHAADSYSLRMAINEFERKWNELVRRGVASP